MNLTNVQMNQMLKDPKQAAQLAEIFRVRNSEETAYRSLGYLTLLAFGFGILGGGILGFIGAVLLSVSAYYATFVFFLGAKHAIKPVGMLITTVGWFAPVVLLVSLFG